MMRRNRPLMMRASSPGFPDSDDSSDGSHYITDSDSGSDSISISDSDPISDSGPDDYISDSGSESSVCGPLRQPERNQAAYSVSQVRRAAVPRVIPAPAPLEGGATIAEVLGTAINEYLSTNGRIPMTPPRPEDSAPLNAPAAPGDSQPPQSPPRQRPLICAYCNCAFCFDRHEAKLLDLGPGHVYPAPPEPITLDLLTPPKVWPLYRDGRDRDPPARMLVCSSEHHFRATMGNLQRPPGGAPSLAWTCTAYGLRVLPVVVGSEGASAPDLHAVPPPPLEPWRYAGAYWNYVEVGHEDMVQLQLHHDPLNLTLASQ